MMIAQNNSPMRIGLPLIVAFVVVAGAIKSSPSFWSVKLFSLMAIGCCGAFLIASRLSDNGRKRAVAFAILAPVMIGIVVLAKYVGLELG